MFFAEFASGYAREKGKIKKNTPALNVAKEMARICKGVNHGGWVTDRSTLVLLKAGGPIERTLFKYDE